MFVLIHERLFKRDRIEWFVLILVVLQPQRPRRRTAAEQRDELAPSHSITSSKRASSVCGTVSSSALAVLRLITNSVFVDCWTGRSAGFSPLRMRPMYMPARRYASVTLAP